MRCRFGHDHSRWGAVYETMVVVLGSFGRPSDSPRVYQDRICHRCKRVEARFIRKGTLPKERAEYDNG